MTARPDTAAVAESAVGTKPQGGEVNQKKGRQMTRENTVNVPHIDYEVWQNGDMVASASDIADAQHYMAIYGQDGPVEAWTNFSYQVEGFTDAPPLYAAPPPSVEVFGSSAEGADTHRDADGAIVADALTERLTKVAYATEFLDVREDILALIERDRTRWLDNIAVCELLAKARADLARIGGPDRPRR